MLCGGGGRGVGGYEVRVGRVGCFDPARWVGWVVIGSEESRARSQPQVIITILNAANAVMNAVLQQKMYREGPRDARSSSRVCSDQE